jgi:hypothetical protein
VKNVLLAYYYFSCICNFSTIYLLSVSLHYITLLIEEPLHHKHMFRSETAPLVCYFISPPHACSCSYPGFVCCFWSTLAVPDGFSSIPMISSHDDGGGGRAKGNLLFWEKWGYACQVGYEDVAVVMVLWTLGQSGAAVNYAAQIRQFPKNPIHIYILLFKNKKITTLIKTDIKIKHCNLDLSSIIIEQQVSSFNSQIPRYSSLKYI